MSEHNQSTIETDRHLGLGGSDAMRLMNDDWLTLYNEKVGLTEPEDLSNVFRVQLGIWTEPFHLKWLAFTEGFSLELPNQRFQHAHQPFMFTHLDGWHKEDEVPIEVKHTNAFNTVSENARYYMPQLQHIIAVTDAPFIYFSAICGNKDPEMVKVSRNQEYIEELIGIEKSFWWHVEKRVPPEITPKGKQKELAKAAQLTPVNDMRPYDMSSHNEWAVLAADYIEHGDAAKAFEAAKKELKKLVPDDACECSGHGVTIKRDKRGALRFS